MSKTALTVKGLSVTYDHKRVLTNIHLDIDSGHVYGVIGPNGAGKSTLFKAALGLAPMSSGSIQVFGKDVDKVRARVAYVPQKDEVDWSFPARVQDIVEMGRYPHKRVLQRLNQKDKAITDEAMEQLGISDLKNRQIGQLSGGQQQRVFIARALAQEADLFFLDEPFVGVDITTEEKIIDILKSLAAQGKTLLVVHHDLSTVNEYFDKVIMLNQRLIAYGDVETTFTDEKVANTYGPQLTILNKTFLT